MSGPAGESRILAPSPWHEVAMRHVVQHLTAQALVAALPLARVGTAEARVHPSIAAVAAGIREDVVSVCMAR
jgi:hypothetical protein